MFIRSLTPRVVLQEVPDEVALAFVITGCPLRCSGCHSQHTWDKWAGSVLTNQSFQQQLERYQALISCVLFFGGEWHSQALVEKLVIAHQQQLKTCLYTGLDKLPKRILQHLDYVKTGPWLAERGGLSDANSNQRFIDLRTNQCLNYKFHSAD